MLANHPSPGLKRVPGFKWLVIKYSTYRDTGTSCWGELTLKDRQDLFVSILSFSSRSLGYLTNTYVGHSVSSKSQKKTWGIHPVSLSSIYKIELSRGIMKHSIYESRSKIPSSLTPCLSWRSYRVQYWFDPKHRSGQVVVSTTRSVRSYRV